MNGSTGNVPQLSTVESIVGALYAQVAADASAPALCDDEHALSFADLLEAARNVHRLLEGIGVSPGQRVAIYSDNAVEYIIAVFGILHAGCTFVPLPFRDPPGRTQRLCGMAGTAAVFSGRKHIEGAGRVIDIAEVINRYQSASCSGEVIPHFPAKLDEVPAYVIFTSGSSGEPKGVCISHRSFFHAANEAGRIMRFDGATKSLALLPLHFDGSFSSVFPIIMRGGSVFVNRGVMCLPMTFCDVFRRHGITHTTMTPSYLEALLESEDWSAARCDTWRTLAVGGEAPPKAALRRLRQQLPHLRFFNRYGPTEATMAVSTTEISSEMLSSEDRIPIGLPHEGVSFAVMGAAGTLVGPGETGELYIGGRQLMLGYLDDSAMTDAVMHRSGPDGQRFYKTGDLVVVNAAGQYVFIERSDNVVKRHGVRIALAEIEAALAMADGVAAAACVSLPAARSVEIVAFIKRRYSTGEERDIRRELLRQLPAYMNPDSIVFVNEIPKTANGKTDHAALRLIAAQRGSSEESDVRAM